MYTLPGAAVVIFFLTIVDDPIVAFIKVKVKLQETRPRRPREDVQVQLYSFFNLGAK
jgi:hypothetical protein